MMRVQASVFPIESQNPDDVIKGSIEALRRQGLECQVGPISTEITGDPEKIWQGLKDAFETAVSQSGEVSMTVTFTNSQP